jgi:lambda family phage tail tape measure protein
MAFAALTIDLNARLAKFEQDLARAGKSMDGLNKRAAALSTGIKTVFAGVGVAGVAAFVKSSIDAADALNDLSDRTGVAVKDLASLDLAAKLSDTSLDSVGKAIQRLNLSVGQAADGSKEIAKSLTDLGVTSTDARERLFQIADAYKASGGQGKILADIQKVLGKSYTDLIPLLKQGGDGLRKLAQESETYADTIARLAPDAAKFNDQLDELRQNSALAAAQIATVLVPAMNKILENVQQAQQLSASGFGFFQVLGLGINPTQDPAAQLDVVNSKLEQLQRSLAANSKQPFLQAQVDQLKELRTLLLDQVVTDLMKPPTKPGTKPPGTLDFKSTLSKSAKVATDPLASIISQTDTAKLAEYEKLLNLLSARFDDGRKNAVQFQEALAILNKQFGFEQIDIFGSFKTTDKAVADFIKEQQDAINEFNREMAEDGVAAAEAYKSALDSLLADTTLVKTEALYENIDLLNQAFFDGLIGIQQYEEAIANITGKTSEVVKQTNSLAEELGLTFTSAFEDAIVSGESFRDILKGIEQDILRIITRKLITEPLGSALTGFLGGLIPSANGNVFNSPALSAYSGSVVSKPTVFPFASGIGIMGEAGAEAILPLKRGRNGKLGVESQGGGGGTVVHMHINTPDANSFRKSTGQITAQVSGALSRARRNM